MKAIGPYVISAPPAGGMNRAGSAGPATVSAVREPSVQTLYGVERVTGIAALLHRLPPERYGMMLPPSLPPSPSLLPVTEMDDWEGHLYAVTELPHTAALATHPAEVASGVLMALEALHGAGMAHGGVGLEQFWQVGRTVQLAGAGLPWQEQATPEGDMQALAAALDALGGRPAPLRRLETMTAAQALAALGTKPPAEVLPPTEVPRLAPATAPAHLPAVQENPVTLERLQETAPEQAAEIVIAPVLSAPASISVPDRAAEEATAVASEQPAQSVPVPYRSASDIIVIGDAPDAVQTPAPRLVPAPIRIGFEENAAAEAEQPTPVAVPPLDWTLPADPPTVPVVLIEIGSPPEAAPLPAVQSPEAPSVESQPPTGVTVTASGRQLQPVRIGWEEDNSWRVVKPLSERPATVPRPRLPLWALSLLVLLVLAGGVWVAVSSRSSGAAGAAACCPVVFRVEGQGAEPVRITVVQSPPGSPLGAGALIGTAPGELKFPDVQGTYRLKFEAKGHAAMMSNLTVPSSAPFVILLK
ncbi:hypothetical protein MF271_08535 [Deinococcus sp. KNUC1210]|uniref:hypothetical protein n=1 Tax=Deinococcus sp. KNUC1210 TaxID=2917691 RepID=UPI001EF03724|nr:hypothetical protein [Deinococcus sp. KNUC1210]ULH16605.1 hypothetical protein MF271_08535 [Deinococcus sp. KNUC1210]